MAEPGPAARWLAGLGDAAALYCRPRLIVVLLLGFASGLPLLLSFSTLSAWLREAGVDRTSIGLFTLVGVPYAIKFLWAPLIDRMPLPLLTRLLGRRRGWLVATQLAVGLSIVGLGMVEPGSSPFLAAGFALLVAFASASQDIVFDAYRIETLDESEQAAGAAMTVFGYRVGTLVAGAGALFLADSWGWHAAYVLMACLMLPAVAVVLLSPEPPDPGLAPIRGATRLARVRHWLAGAVLAPLADFMRRPGWMPILLFILLYKLGDAFLGAMANPFYIDLGFSKTEIAEVSKLFGLAATFAGLAVGGMMVRRFGLLVSLLVCGVLQAASNMVFIAQVMAGHDVPVLMVTIAVENLTGGMGTAVFVAYLSQLTNVAFTATQYALLSSFMAVGRSVLASPSGAVADQVGWIGFFLTSTAVAIPGLLLLLVMMRRYPAHAVRHTGTMR